MVVFLVSRGEYSDYSPVAVFSSMEKAQEFCNASRTPNDNFYGYGWNDVEELPFDPGSEEK
jgi:hypothetical protein